MPWPVEEAAAWAMSWQSTHAEWLLIFDNVEQAADLHSYLGRLARGSVLITTRRDIGWQAMGCTSVHLDVLDPQAATAVLATLTESADPGD
ncbi:hypothetical protein [Sphaerisporangium corydalis]|uniref:NB-ARC domain-containing protein n=1 Tax=Sphaerisporangium corydalis TaxID=1441875 RepID=A0ABV9EMS3_9ACTN|nr:hypothetical protein [Sphaerisporangium corydalis]